MPNVVKKQWKLIVDRTGDSQSHIRILGADPDEAVYEAARRYKLSKHDRIRKIICVSGGSGGSTPALPK